MNDVITRELLLDALTSAGLGDRTAARRIIDATISVLFEGFTRDERAIFGRCLSPGLATNAAAEETAERRDAEEVYRRIAERAGTSASFAREQAQVIVETIGRHAPYEAMKRLSGAWPSGIEALLSERELGEPPPYVETFPAAQAHSVVREDNPHGDRKLSSGHPVLRPSDAARAARQR